MSSISKYFYIFKSTWQENLAYRLNFFLEILGGAAFFGSILFLWSNIYKNSSGSQIGGYTFSEMITYIVGSGLIYGFILLTAQGDEIDDDINEGYLSNYLLKPLNVNLYWLVKDFARKILTAFLGILAFAAVLLMARKFLLSPSSFNLAILTFFAVGLGSLLHFVFFYLASVISFWFGRTWGFRFVIRVTMEIAAGTILPISFLPAVWRDIFDFLPFKFIAYFPMQIYLGKFSANQILWGFVWGVVWLAILSAMSWLIWKRGLANYTASGA